MYQGADSSWLNMPRIMSNETRRGLIDALRYLHSVQQRPPLVVFHGGEPLLSGVSSFLSLVDDIVSEIPDAQLSIQTNGTIYNDQLEAGLLRHRANLSFSLSVDGFRTDNDRHRLGLKKESRYARIETTIVRARDAGLLDNILIVVDPDVDPHRIFDFMEWAAADSYNLLLRDGDYETLPPGKATTSSINVGVWLTKIFSLYAQGNPSFTIAILDEAAKSVLARQSGLPRTHGPRSCVLTVDTDGEIKQVDTLRINGDQMDRLTGARIGAAGIRTALASDPNLRLMQIEDDVSEICRSCEYLEACGGGYLQHRYGNGSFRNPSIYCADYRHLFSVLERALCH